MTPPATAPPTVPMVLPPVTADPAAPPSAAPPTVPTVSPVLPQPAMPRAAASAILRTMKTLLMLLPPVVKMAQSVVSRPEGRPRRALGRDEPRRAVEVVAGHRVGDRRHVGEHRGTPRQALRDHAQPSRLPLRHRRGRGRERPVRLTGGDRTHR